MDSGRRLSETTEEKLHSPRLLNVNFTAKRHETSEGGMLVSCVVKREPGDGHVRMSSRERDSGSGEGVAWVSVFPCEAGGSSISNLLVIIWRVSAVIVVASSIALP